jgi:hypothetical protein
MKGKVVKVEGPSPRWTVLLCSLDSYPGTREPHIKPWVMMDCHAALFLLLSSVVSGHLSGGASMRGIDKFEKRVLRVGLH